MTNCVIKNVYLRTRNSNVVDITQNKNDIVEDREKTFRKYFKHLVSLNLIVERSTRMEKGSGYTFEYKLTKLGNLVGLIINTEFMQDKKGSYDMLYSHLESHFNNQPSSVDVFCKTYLKRCKDNGLFEIFVHNLKRNILYPNKHIENENDIFTQMILLRTNDKKINRKLWKLWYSSFCELNIDIQYLLTKHLKLTIDRIISESIGNIQHYENVMFRCKDIFHDVIVEYRCLRCDYTCSINSITVLQYLHKLFDGIRTEKILNSKVTHRCPKCNFKRMRISTI